MAVRNTKNPDMIFITSGLEVTTELIAQSGLSLVMH